MILLVCLTVVDPLQADSIWTGNVNSDWLVSGNWNPASVPDGSEDVRIENGGTAILGGALATGDSFGLYVASAGGSFGGLQINGGANLRTYDIGSLADGTGATAAVTVSGANTLWDIDFGLTVGRNGTADLTIQSGGTVWSGSGVIGSAAGSLGTVDVVGTNSVWSMGNASGRNLEVGGSGTGNLTISLNGQVDNYNGRVAAGAGSVGVVTVAGSGARWINHNILIVGNRGNGTLNIVGGQVDSVNSYVGYGELLSPAVGVVNVAGAGSVWNSTNILTVGDAAQGTLNILADGTVNSSGTNKIGGIFAGSGTVNVDGPGAHWNQTGVLYISDGSSTQGRLNVLNQGNVTSQNVFMANAAGSVAWASVSGNGSIWSATGNFVVGQAAGATLNVTSGGRLHTPTTAALGGTNTGVGVVNVSGNGSTWTATQIRIGDFGLGQVQVSSGGNVSAGSASLGTSSAGFANTLTVTGNQSVFSTAGNLRVGVIGCGTLTVASGGRVSVGGALAIAPEVGLAGSGRIRVGVGGAAGIIDAASVGAGPLAVNPLLDFDHNEAGYFFTRNGSASGAAIPISGGVQVRQLGTGTTALLAASTYTGGTAVNGGTLVITDVGPAQSVLGTGPVQVGANGTLAGNGTVLGSTTVAGVLAPGNSVGQMTFASALSLSDTATVRLEIAGPGVHDTVTVGGLLEYAGALEISFLDGYLPDVGDSFDLFDLTSFELGSEFDAILFDEPGYAGTFQYSSGVLTISAIPEPSTLLLVGMGVLAVARRRRRMAG
jgi:T5SS/PEP-CTERM-associated repeat protein/autotransporter-associated beta strand protein